MDKDTLKRIENLEEIILDLIDQLEIKTTALRELYNENVRRLREQNKLEGMDKR